MSIASDGTTDVSKEQYEEVFDVPEEREPGAGTSSMTYCSTHDCAICT